LIGWALMSVLLVLVLESQVKDLLAAKTEVDLKIEKSQSAEEKLRQTTELMESDQKAFKIVKEKLCRVR
jgi:hypothetical protein